MAELAAIELHHVALPTRREHEWSGLTEAIGGYVLVEMTDAAGTEGWGEAPVLMDWGGEFGGYFGESPGTTIEVLTRHLAPAVKGCRPGEIVELHARMDHSVPMPRRRWNSPPMILPAVRPEHSAQVTGSKPRPAPDVRRRLKVTTAGFCRHSQRARRCDRGLNRKFHSVPASVSKTYMLFAPAAQPGR
jgi:hypothetical protein